MNILKRIFTLFLSFLSRVHLVRRKDKLVLTCKTVRTRSGLYDHSPEGQKEVHYDE